MNSARGQELDAAMAAAQLEVRAHVEARLLGLKILTLDVRVVTADRRQSPHLGIPVSSHFVADVKGNGAERPTLARAMALLDQSSMALAALSPGPTPDL